MAPFCERRQRGEWPAAESVHHIRPVQNFPQLALIAENTAPVCNECHSIVETLERAGKSTAHLFDGWQQQEIDK
jgi:hypothetical protein